jgi:hypothetical protein
VKRTAGRITYSGLADLPSSARRYLVEEGLVASCPARGFVADESLRIQHIGLRPWVRLGSTALRGVLALDLSSGEVIEFPDLRRPDVMVWANVSVAAFDACATTLNSLLPLYPADASEEEQNDAAERVKSALQGFDGDAVMPDTFWGDVLDSIRIGDYGDVLAG